MADTVKTLIVVISGINRICQPLLPQVDIPDVAGATLESMLHWVYGATLPREAITPSLLAAADKYDLASLKASI